ncbi:MAG: DeoR/GlpR family DNA-binding transcription regulator, partial [Clostridiales bacterium]|nr:DeoR/GlpR family DNA-binding transcription regulator [Clostridiales bacterium]
MLAEERVSRILEILKREGSVSVQQLIEELSASESTIRRDLNEMDARGLLVKVHGGAMAKNPNESFAMQDLRVSSRMELNAGEKSVIGSYAAGLVQPDDFVFLDAGTTTAQLIEHLEETRAVFVTNSIGHVLRLAQRGFRAYILGGECKSVTEAIVGAETVLGLEKYNFTKCFMGANGVSAERGFTTPDVREAIVKMKAFKQSKVRYVLADSMKFDVVST